MPQRGQRGAFTIMKNKETWKLIIQTVISILSAIATTLGLNSCLWVMSLNRKCRNPLTTQNSKICGHLSHRRHLRAIIEWWVNWQLTPKNTKTHRNEVGFVFLGHFNAQTPPQNTPFLALFAKNAKTKSTNYNNINTLHFAFCILFPLNAWIMEIFYYFLSDTKDNNSVLQF